MIYGAIIYGFYHNLSDMTDTFIGMDILPNKTFPIIFDSISGACQKSNHSFFNEDEVTACMGYVQRLLKRNVDASNIGIYLFPFT